MAVAERASVPLGEALSPPSSWATTVCLPAAPLGLSWGVLHPWICQAKASSSWRGGCVWKPLLLSCLFPSGFLF